MNSMNGGFIYLMLIGMFYALYIGVLLGLKINKKYVHYFSIFIQTIVGLFLAYRFFPYRKKVYKLEPGDEQIIFGCATFLLANVGFTEYIRQTIETDITSKKVISDISGAIQDAIEKKNTTSSEIN